MGLGRGRCLRVVVPFACGLLGRSSRFWAARIVRGGGACLMSDDDDVVVGIGVDDVVVVVG